MSGAAFGSGLSFEVGRQLYSRVGRYKRSLEVNFFMSNNFKSRQELTLVYPGIGTQVLPSNENPACILKEINKIIILTSPPFTYSITNTNLSFVWKE